MEKITCRTALSHHETNRCLQRRTKSSRQMTVGRQALRESSTERARLTVQSITSWWARRVWNTSCQEHMSKDSDEPLLTLNHWWSKAQSKQSSLSQTRFTTRSHLYNHSWQTSIKHSYLASAGRCKVLQILHPLASVRQRDPARSIPNLSRRWRQWSIY